MQPILLVHGYSTDASSKPNRDSVAKMYGDLPRWLRREYGNRSVFELDISRYISLEDGIGIDDISRAFDNALRTDFKHLRDGQFHVIIHSTGALVIRNWIRKFAGANQPIRNLIHLAGANFGSGWAHIGKGQLARWGREIWTGSEAGVKVLNALELGSSDTLDMQIGFIADGSEMVAAHKVREFVIIGTQPKTALLSIPVRYAKEDGSDGVVRVSASNLNFTYVKYVANPAGRKVTARQVRLDTDGVNLPESCDYYKVDWESLPGIDRRVVPLAIPWGTAHSGGDVGVVDGSQNRSRIEPLLRAALATSSPAQWQNHVATFQDTTDEAYRLASEREITGLWKLKRWSRKPQYEAHSQIIVRLRDQDGRPVPDFDINFRRGDHAESATDIGGLIEHKHRNLLTPNVITFYLRTGKWDWDDRTFLDDDGNYLNRLADVDDVVLDITGEERQTDDIQYVPFRKHFDGPTLMRYVKPHATTIIDIEMLRIPAPDVFRVFKH
jgi:hypothetical protein